MDPAGGNHRDGRLHGGSPDAGWAGRAAMDGRWGLQITTELTTALGAVVWCAGPDHRLR